MSVTYLTPKENWIAGSGIGLTDMNRIEGNIDYIRNQDADLFGTKKIIKINEDKTDFYESLTFRNRYAGNHTDTYTAGEILFQGWKDSSDPAYISGIWSTRSPEFSGASSNGDLHFGTTTNPLPRSSGLPSSRFTILSNGNTTINDGSLSILQISGSGINSILSIGSSLSSANAGYSIDFNNGSNKYSRIVARTDSGGVTGILDFYTSTNIGGNNTALAMSLSGAGGLSLPFGTGAGIRQAISIGGTIDAVNAGYSIDFNNGSIPISKIVARTDSGGVTGSLAWFTTSNIGVAATEKMSLNGAGDLFIARNISIPGAINISSTTTIGAGCTITSAGALTVDGAINPTTTTTIGAGCTITSAGVLTSTGINTDNAIIKQKYFSGVANASGNVALTHGLDYTKIVSIQTFLLTGANYTDRDTFNHSFTSTDGICVTNDSATFASAPYRSIITYLG